MGKPSRVILEKMGGVTEVLPDDCIQLPSEKNESKEPTFVNSKNEHETDCEIVRGSARRRMRHLGRRT
jgi:hypothetical protein